MVTLDSPSPYSRAWHSASDRGLSLRMAGRYNAERTARAPALEVSETMLP